MLAMSEEKKTAQVLVRLSPTERSQLEREAEKQRRPAAQLARMLLLDGLGRSGEPLRVAPSADDPREPHTTTFPIVALAAAGSGRDVELVETGETVEVANTLARTAQRSKWSFVRVVGDSMEPSFFDGDIVAIAPAKGDISKIRNREIVYVRLNGDPQIKELHVTDKGRRITLMPRNTRAHDPIPILESDTLELIGVVRDLAHRADAGRKI